MAELRDQLQETLGSQYVLEQELGGGGMSRVFVAHEASLGRKVVVKVLPPDMAASVSIDRFRREIQLAAQLQHPHIVPLLNAGETQGLPYFTMPFVKGESLRAKLARGGELPLSEAVRILREVAAALSYAHENHVVHRDIKPENILISGGSAMVTDFGVAKAVSASSGGRQGQSLTSLGVALGTPAYMAPEQATADPNTDHRADIYALGVVAYEMLTGATPFSGRSPQAMLAAHVTESPDNVTKRRATIPPLLANLVMCCLEKRAADRPQTAADVVHELDALSTPSGGMTPTSLHPAAAKRGIPKAVTIGAAALVAAAIIAFATMKFAGGKSAPVVAEPAAVPGIAVLPFENRGREEGQEFTDGMTEEITNRLSSIRSLRVIGRQSARTYAASTKSPQEIAKELGVDYVLTGTVRWDKSADGKELVRVSPALLRASDGTQVWADAYQTVLSGMFEVQAKVATEVASALNIALVAPEKNALAARPTMNVEAYSYYLRGSELVVGSTRMPDLKLGIESLQEAVKADPNFAQAYARLGMGHVEYFWFFGDRSAARLKMAKAAIDKALSINPDLPEGHFALGVYYYHGFLNYQKALEEFAVAERLRPGDFLTVYYSGLIKRRTGDFAGASVQMERALEIEPKVPSLYTDLGYTYNVLGRHDEAERMARQALVLDPKSVEAGQILMIAHIGRDANVPAAIGAMKQVVSHYTDRNFAAQQLLGISWPLGNDPDLKSMMQDVQWSEDAGDKGVFYTYKALCFMFYGNVAAARTNAAMALPLLIASAKADPRESGFHNALAIVHAILGHRDEAVFEAKRAMQETPVSRDAYSAPNVAFASAIALTIAGANSDAITALETAIRQPANNTRNFAKLHPVFAPLRADPRFRKLVGL
ncbi:MAG: protein kinase [Gemmatimonadaceae bacterium]|nr:protein kinase [Gemmatimonadaceae bacterium]